MNNAQENRIQKETNDALLERKEFLNKIVEDIQELNDTPAWKRLQKNLFNDVLGSLERRILAETKKPVIDSPEVYRLQGQIAWARKYSNLNDLQETFKVELRNLTHKNNENS